MGFRAEGMTIMKYYIGMDFGGMSAKAGLFSADGKLVCKDSVKTSKEDGYSLTVDKLAELAQVLIRRSGKRAECLGIGSPGVIDGSAGVVVRWGNFDWKDAPLAADLAKRTGLPVKLANDANVAALGEAKFGAGKKYGDSVLLTLGTGIGSGIILGGKIFEGFCGGGAEAGHMVIEAGGIPCSCGRRGCFEQYASATALIRDTKRAMFEYKDSLLWSLAGEPENVSGKTAFEAARGGDAAAQKVVKNYIMYLGEGILNLVNIFRPEAIMIGGGISNEGEYLLQPLRKYVSERLYVDCERIPLVIVRATLGSDAGMVGALALAADK